MGTKRLRLVLFTLLAGLFLVGTTVPAQAQFGASAGLNFQSAGDISSNTDATLERSTGYHIGLVYSLGLGPLDVRPGFFYRRLGQTYELPNSVAEANAHVAAWEVPVDLKFGLISAPLASPYVIAGPKASFLRSDLEDIDDELESVSYSIAIGIGADISIGSTILQPELRYDYGTTDYINESFEIGDTTFTQQDPTLSAFALRLNVLF